MHWIFDLEIFIALSLGIEVFIYSFDNVLAKYPLKYFFVSKYFVVSFFPNSLPKMGKSNFPQETNITILRRAILALKNGVQYCSNGPKQYSRS